MNILQDALTTQEEIDKARRMEAVRRRGYQFIRIRYSGTIIPAVDTSGIVVNLRIGQVNDPRLYQEHNPETGQEETKTRIETSQVQFYQDRITGDIVADILDDEHNRFFIASHIGFGFEVMDPKLAKEIDVLIGSPYKVEVGKRESLLREKRRIDKELAAIEVSEKDEDEPEEDVGDVAPEKKIDYGINTEPERIDRKVRKRPVKKQGRPPVRRAVNQAPTLAEQLRSEQQHESVQQQSGGGDGVNQPASNVD